MPNQKLVWTAAFGRAAGLAIAVIPLVLIAGDCIAIIEVVGAWEIDGDGLSDL